MVRPRKPSRSARKSQSAPSSRQSDSDSKAKKTAGRRAPKKSPNATKKRSRTRARKSTKSKAKSSKSPTKKRKRTRSSSKSDVESEATSSSPKKKMRLASSARKYIGAHCSTAGGLERAVVNAAAIGATALALDVRNKRRWVNPPRPAASIQAFKDACKQFGFTSAQILPHGSYLINLGSPKEELRLKSRAAFLEELQRCEELGITLYNFHPGASTGGDEKKCLAQIAEEVNIALKKTSSVVAVLECTAGGGSVLGHSLEQLKYIIDRVDNKSRVGVCLDTCHLYAAGYDISTAEKWKSFINDFDETIGLSYLRALHLNDSKGELASRRDRHENIGKGHIGIALFKAIMKDSRFDHMPMIIETPIQNHGPKIDYSTSLRQSEIVFLESESSAGVNTDKRDLAKLRKFAECC